MIKINYLIFFTVLFFSSCLSDSLKLTNSEAKGVKEVLSVYGGECAYSKGWSASTGQGKKIYFELEISKSESVDGFSEKSFLPMSGIAYTFYKNLSEKERNKYTHIKTVLHFGKGGESEYEFPVGDLKIADSFSHHVKWVTDNLMAKKFEKLVTTIFDNTKDSMLFDKTKMIKEIGEYEERKGAITGANILGYTFAKQKNILHFSGVLYRPETMSQFGMDVDISSREGRVMSFAYEF